jgi:hypothetical protein
VTDNSPQRSFKETAVETAVISSSFVVVVALIVMMSAGAPYNGVQAFEVAASAGDLLFDELGWVMTIYITVLLGFYAVSIGGQIFGGQDSADATRRTMGFVAELMAASTVSFVGFILVYCWQHPSHWPVLVVLIPVVGILVFLALHLGTFVVPRLESQIAQAEKLRGQLEARLGSVRIRSTRNIYVVTAVNLMGIAAAACAVVLPISDMTWANVALLGLSYLGLSLVLLAADILALHSFFTFSDRLSRAITGVVMPVLTNLIIAMLIFLPGMPVQFGVSLAVVVIGTAVTAFWPRRFSPLWFIDWSIKGAIANWAHASLEKQRGCAAANFDKLSAERAEQEAREGDPSLFRRLLQAWNAPASDSAEPNQRQRTPSRSS